MSEIKSPEYWHQQAQTRSLLSSDHRKALKHIDKAIELDAKQKRYWFLKGHLLRELGKHDEAAECERTGESLPGDAF